MRNGIEYLFLIPGFIFLLLASILTQDVLAHGGRTNAEGCHNNRKTGGYHCHGQTGSTPHSASEGRVEGCGSKYYCREMSSCAEAMHYFRDCGLDRLDGDQDGVPCESICELHK